MPLLRPPNSDWLTEKIVVAFLGLLVMTLAYFASRWWRLRGGVRFHIGDRAPAEYITRGWLSEDGRSLVAPAARFMVFKIPVTIENRRKAPLSIRIKQVWFGEHEPQFGKDTWTLPGASLHPLGVEVRDASGAIVEPIRVEGESMAHVIVSGTATTPVFSAEPFATWRYVFIDWITTPAGLKPLVLDRAAFGWTRYEPNLQPTHPLPEHYVRSQAAGPTTSPLPKWS